MDPQKPPSSSSSSSTATSTAVAATSSTSSSSSSSGSPKTKPKPGHWKTLKALDPLAVVTKQPQQLPQQQKQQSQNQKSQKSQPQSQKSQPQSQKSQPRPQSQPQGTLVSSGSGSSVGDVASESLSEVETKKKESPSSYERNAAAAEKKVEGNQEELEEEDQAEFELRARVSKLVESMGTLAAARSLALAIQYLIHSLAHSITGARRYLLIHLFTLSLTHSSARPRSLILSLTHISINTPLSPSIDTPSQGY